MAGIAVSYIATTLEIKPLHRKNPSVAHVPSEWPWQHSYEFLQEKFSAGRQRRRREEESIWTLRTTKHEAGADVDVQSLRISSFLFLFCFATKQNSSKLRVLERSWSNIQYSTIHYSRRLL
eukprot:scaffold4501_cov320-Pinguiococcus_pyrenoidosus.AAC.11